MAVKGNTGWASASDWGAVASDEVPFLVLRVVLTLVALAVCEVPARVADAADVDDEAIECVSVADGIEGCCLEHTLKARRKARY
jgi:hypothetical protein